MPGGVVEVFCRCDRHVALGRYRVRAGTRHPGHFDAARAAGHLWNAEVAEAVAGGWPVLEADTNQPVDVAALARLVRDGHAAS